MEKANKIKDELQGSGFLEEVKEKRLPDSAILTGAAIEKYENEYEPLGVDVINERADQVLQQLLELEREIYNQREQRVYREALVVFLKEKYDTGQTSIHSFSSGNSEKEQFTEYPSLQRLFTELEEIYETETDFEEAFAQILPLLYPAMDAISVSAQQSRRKRAGSSLRSHIENLLEMAGYTIKSTNGSGSGHFYELYSENECESRYIYISYLTTLRDRFRQSLSDDNIDGTDTPQYLMTGSGNSIFTPSSRSDVTEQKVEEITKKGFTLVVFESVKQRRHSEKEDVISYKEFFSDRLPRIF